MMAHDGHRPLHPVRHAADASTASGWLVAIGALRLVSNGPSELGRLRWAWHQARRLRATAAEGR